MAIICCQSTKRLCCGALQVTGLAGGELVAAIGAAAQHGQPAVRSTVRVLCLASSQAIWPGSLASSVGKAKVTLSVQTWWDCWLQH